MSKLALFSLFIWLSFIILPVFAQVSYLKSDSIQLKNKLDTGAFKKKLSGKISSYAQDVKPASGSFTIQNPSQALTPINGKVTALDSQLNKGLKKINQAKIAVNVSVENAVQYQPQVNNASINPGQKFANVFAVRGSILAWGV
jgi:hypothetical protein